MRNIWILIFGIVLSFPMNSCKSDGLRFFYCLSEDRCITVWKTQNGEVYIIYGEYRGLVPPPDDYLKLINMKSPYVCVLLSNNNKLLIDIETNAKVTYRFSNGIMRLYNDDKALNDSMYTYYDGKYRRYKKEVEYISIDIKENYATDKTGQIIK